MIKEAEKFADEDKKVKERVDESAFEGHIHSMRSATEGYVENKGLKEKMDSDEKEKILDALKDGQSWIDSNPEADAEEIKKKHEEFKGNCAPSASKYYGAGGGANGAGGGEEPKGGDAHRVLQRAQVSRDVSHAQVSRDGSIPFVGFPLIHLCWMISFGVSLVVVHYFCWPPISNNCGYTFSYSRLLFYPAQETKYSAGDGRGMRVGKCQEGSDSTRRVDGASQASECGGLTQQPFRPSPRS